MTRTLKILERLIAFPTVSKSSNRALIAYVTGLLDEAGIAWELAESEDGMRTNLFATVGPRDRGGVMLSGHTDVVPAAGQVWSRDPFALHVEGGLCYGRGTADMKGFVAAAIAMALEASKRELKTPLHLALSYDEEIGCVGVRRLLDVLRDRNPLPAFCIVGEPTGMQIATGHKGKVALHATCHGHAGHSALAPKALNALHMGADFLGVLRHEQARLATDGAQDGAYDVPYSTVHVGVMRGGEALNIVPDRCDIDFEIRNLAEDDPKVILARIAEGAEAVVAPWRVDFPQAAIEIAEVNAYPGLDTEQNSPLVRLMQSILGPQSWTTKVAFGTEAGLFSDELGIPAVICGPGHMDQGHKPDEFIALDQLAACDAMLARLLDRLENGI
ncbi:acetylornithine deacetylase [Devosia sp. YR412]|uniref:acetylornithine deacetylase n=1 Tax=Devosia sp. YR412 TaxID=1881030 RepID=UPI0008D7960F|nr:acetylornithine deacetylase [Devosia sp. YR412]SEQ54087.1 acetylornithine deacetylase [Devosia sp. YR412]